MNQKNNTIFKGSTTKQMKELAKALRDGEEALDFEWDSDEDREQYADIVERVAELKEICPAIHGSFALRCTCSDGKFHRHSPTLVISEDTINTTGKSKEDWLADSFSTRCELIAKQVGVLADEIGVPSEELLGDIMAANYRARRNITSDKKIEIRLRALASVLPVIDDLIDMKKEAVAATLALAMREFISDDKEEEDDNEEEEKASDDQDKKDDSETLKVIELKGKDAERVIKEIVNKLGKKEDKDDGECGGSCCRKCSRNKKS